MNREHMLIKHYHKQKHREEINSGQQITKVLLTLESFSNVKGGVEVFSSHLSKVFPDLQIIDLNKAKKFDNFSFFSPLKQPLQALAVQKYLLKHLDELNPEVIFANGEFGWYLNKSKLSIPLITINHGSWKTLADVGMPKTSLNYFRIRYIYSTFEKKSFQNADKIVCNSKFTCDLMKENYGLDGEIIYNAIDTEIFKPLNKEICRRKLHLPLDKKIALFVGNPVYRKGFDIVQKLSHRFSNVLFVFVTFPKLNIMQDNVRCFEAVPGEKLALFYNAADVLLFPSRFEGFGYVPLEALACNTKVLAFKTGALWDFYTELNSKDYIKNVEKHDFEEFLKAFETLIEFEQRFNSNKFIEKNFSMDLFIKNYRSLID